MRHKQSRSVLSSIFASKRIAVALCAAIAMVLGAMSVGASMNNAPDSPNDPLSASQSSSAITASSFETNPDLPKTIPSSSVNVPSQQAAVVVPILIAEPGTNSQSQDKDKSKNKNKPSLPKVSVNVTTPLGPISINTQPKGASIQLDTPVTDPLNVIVTTPPAQSSSDAPADSNNTGSTDTPPSNSDNSSNPQQPMISTGSNNDNIAQN